MIRVKFSGFNRKYFNRLWVGFWQLSDPKIWIASTIPLLVAAALAYQHTGSINKWWFIISLSAVYLIEIGKNAVNEFVDYDSGVDSFVEPTHRTPFSGGKKTIIENKLSSFEVKIIAVLTLLSACGLGLFIMIFREPHIFWIGFVGVMLSVFYTLPPFKLSYKGFGEAAVAISFGPLMISGMYLVLTNSLHWEIALVGMPIAFMIANVLWINQFPDYEADTMGDKKNLLVRIGKKTGVKIYSILFICAYVSLIGFAFYFRNPFWLLGWSTIPLAIQSIRTAQMHMNDISKLTSANGKTILIYQIIGVMMIVAILLH